MAKFTFIGGVHPDDGKSLSKDKPIRDYRPYGDMVYPLSQHIGAPAKPIVAKGDRVLKGQKIAEAGGFVSAPIYSSVSGTVKVIEKRRVPVGDMVDSIVIENDGLFEEVAYTVPAPYETLSPDQIKALIQEAGVVGMGGAGFPAHVKLSPKDPDKIDYIIANCAECEPYLTSDYRRMLEEPEKLIGGMKIVLSMFKNARGILAVEDNKPDCIELLRKLTRDESRIEVRPLLTKYPQGSERQLIYAVTGRAINSKMLPADAGCIVNNVDTLVSINRAVTEGRPLMARIVTVTGDAITEPGNFRVPIGTNARELIEAAGGFKDNVEKIISGGPMMGFALFGLDVPITKTSSAFTCFKKDPVAACSETACISCGRCVEACPSRLVPSKLADYASNGNEEMFLKYNGIECMECGSCAYVCPAKRQLTQIIKTYRKIELAKLKAQGGK